MLHDEDTQKIKAGSCYRFCKTVPIDGAEAGLWCGIRAPSFVTSLEVAEMVKYCDNAFHAVKITFANEIGQLMGALGLHSQDVMEIVCADKKLNISPAYLKPGFAFGGSCLPKDLRALLYQATDSGLDLPLLRGVLASNGTQIESLIKRIDEKHPSRIGMVGLAFKPNTDDVRESPLVILGERLLSRGYELQVYDPQLGIRPIVGSNRDYVERHLPQLSQLMVPSLNELCSCDMIVVGHPLNDATWPNRWLEEGKTVLDLVGMYPSPEHPGYQGLYWSNRRVQYHFSGIP